MVAAISLAGCAPVQAPGRAPAGAAPAADAASAAAAAPVVAERAASTSPLAAAERAAPESPLAVAERAAPATPSAVAERVAPETPLAAAERVAPATPRRAAEPLSLSLSISDRAATASPAVAEEAAPEPPQPVVRIGTGEFFKSDAAPRYSVTTTGGDVKLNFEQAELRQVVTMILGELLGETYYLDPSVKGTVTVENDTPLRRDQLVPILEQLLLMNGAALVKAPVGYRIVPIDQAERQALPPSTRRWPPSAESGYAARIIPLRFASADEVAKILTPYVPAGGTLRAVPLRNILILSAPGHTVEEFVETVRVFDVDWLAGMSMGMFPLSYAEAATVANELELLLDTKGETPMAGMVRLFPIERLNAVLVVTSQPRYLGTMRTWIEDLDRGGETPGRRLYIYPVKNSKADHIASVLTEVFLVDDDGAPRPTATASIAPGLQPVTISATPSPATPVTPQPGAPQPGTPGAAAPPATPSAAAQASPPSAGAQPSAQPDATAPAAEASGLLADLSSVRIIPDTLNNTLLVMATRAEYATIEAAIRKLDILPRQVLVEATIAEVQLNNNLQYGVQWFMKGTLGRFGVEYRSVTGGSVDLPRASAPGFSASVFESPADVRVFINALETESELRVLSSPQLMVTDNQSASINVGTQVPVITSTGSGGTTGGTVISEVAYRNTGVLLTVTPRINAGGIVSMEISQEVSVVGPPVPPSGNVSVDQRSIQSSVSVQSGETIVLGGLIQERKSDAVTGVPVLSTVPVLGTLFSDRSDDVLRTELIVLITPRVVSDTDEAKAVTRELRQKLKSAGALTL